MYTYNLGLAFERIVEQHAGKVALSFHATDNVSYETLNQQANRFARFLLDIGVEPKDVVCIAGDKNANTFAFMLACLKLGVVYSMLDPESPPERIRKIIATCRPKVLVLSPEFAHGLLRDLGSLGVEIVHNANGALHRQTDAYDDSNLRETSSVTGTTPSYIMYTSGSTGIPKGAVMTHRNVLNLIAWSGQAFDITSADTLTNVNPLYFDNSVFDFYSSLFAGASLAPFAKSTVRDPRALVSAIDHLGCTLWFSVPSLLIFLQTMKALTPDTMRSITRFVFGGEGYPKSKLKQLYDTYGDRAHLINVYGPTECTCICSAYRITDADFEDLQGFPPLGTMIPNFDYLIIDDDGRCAPPNTTGELCLLGPNVGSGYYNDRERTQASFVQNPCNPAYQELMYRTGDLVKYDSADGKIYIMGRKDNQIKHMGYRIELEEIETALSCLAYVSQAAVLHGSRRGLSQIVAVVSSRDAVADARFREDLSQIIPDYMIPTVFHVVDELPKNPNGKVDRRVLATQYLQ